MFLDCRDGRGVYQTHTRPRPRPRTTRPIGRTVPLHPQRAAQDSRPDGSSGRRAALDSGADLRDRPRKRGDGETLAQALPRRGGVEGLRDEPHPGAPRRVTQEYREGLIHAVRRRPRSLGLPFSVWTLQRLADYMAESTGIRVSYETVRVHLKSAGIVLSRPQHTITSPDPEYALKKRRSRRLATASTLQTTSTMPTSST